jgi:phytol kinase
MNGAREWLDAAAIAGALLVVLGVLRALAAWKRIDGEVLRKAMHVALGASALTYPWLFRTIAPPLLIAVLTLAVLLSLRFLPSARTQLGAVVHGVKRASEGDLWFPVSVVVVFWLASGNAVLYVIPILTLTLADAFAALVGSRYGHMRYDTLEGDQKSAEGSVAFFLIAFFAAHVPLLMYTSVGRTESLLIGLTFGFLVMLLEAVAWRGLDNLFIPVGGFFLLRSYLPQPARALAIVLAMTVAMFAVVVLLRRRRTLSDGAALAAVLVGYLTWIAGGWRWIVPPLVFFVSYTVLWPRLEQVRVRPHRLSAVLAVPGSALLWLALARTLGQTIAYFAYTLTLAANLGFVGVTWFRVMRPQVRARSVLPTSTVVGWVALLMPYLLLEGLDALPRTLVALPVLLLGAASFVAFVPRGKTDDGHDWTGQATIGLATAALGALCVPLMQ